jgi:polyhydroxyalkanoate synthesis repressor PhaR
MEAQASPQITLPSSTEQAITVIKKYKNRKLYDTESSRYVTLKDIYTFFQEGKNVQVINNVNEEDVTVNILLLALAEKSKNQNRTEIASELDRMSKYLTK